MPAIRFGLTIFETKSGQLFYATLAHYRVHKRVAPKNTVLVLRFFEQRGETDLSQDRGCLWHFLQNLPFQCLHYRRKPLLTIAPLYIIITYRGLISLPVKSSVK